MYFFEHFESVEDPRSTINRRHDLLDIMLLTVGAVLWGAQRWKDIKDFGDVKLHWLRQFRAFEDGIPVDDAIARVMSTLAPAAMMSCSVDWVNKLRSAQGAECIAIDGKTFRRSHDGQKK
ncbi:MAG: putative transposase YbfD/YdcC [Gammaproteobacteria bacterium]|jgi:predicted transposase YbfD/YdcC